MAGSAWAAKARRGKPPRSQPRVAEPNGFESNSVSCVPKSLHLRFGRLGISRYFGELKDAVRDLAERIKPSERGYFSPDEEEAVQGILVSYWTSRAALFEVVTAFRTDRELKAEDRPVAFLTAFAAAVLLVDAARFLREAIEHRPLVCDKLNEAVPQFGIPADVYDSIQRSLVSARHAWHLVHAVQYYHDHHDALRSLAGRPELALLLETVERLQHRLDVSLSQFASPIADAGATDFSAFVARYLGRALYGLQQLCGRLMADKYLRYGHRPALPPAVVAQLRDLLAPGDVLAVRKEYALTNYFLPGYWPHVALYLGPAGVLEELGSRGDPAAMPRWRQRLEGCETDPRYVLEALRDGVQIRSIASPCASDSVVVLRPQLGPQDVARALLRGLSHEGKPYDFDFDFRRSDRLVCTEVVYRAYDGISGLQFPLVRRAGRPTLSGSDLIGIARQRRHFVAVAAYAPALARELACDERGIELIFTKADSRSGPATA